MIGLGSIKRYRGPSLDRGPGFIYIEPHPLLSRFIANYTVTCPPHSLMSDDYTVLPSASATLVYSIGKEYITDRLRGINTKAVVVGSQANRYDTLLLIEFHPAGLYPLIRAPQSELLDGSFPFRELDPQLNKEILDAIQAADLIETLKERLDRIFLKRLAGAEMHPQLAFAMDIIRGTHGSADLRTISGSVYLSGRQLERLFSQSLGMGIKTFSRIVRVNHSLRLLQAAKGKMSSIAAEAGYSDQAHFIRDFRELCGVTPRHYLSRMSDFYNDGYKL